MHDKADNTWTSKPRKASEFVTIPIGEGFRPTNPKWRELIGRNVYAYLMSYWEDLDEGLNGGVKMSIVG